MWNKLPVAKIDKIGYIQIILMAFIIFGLAGKLLIAVNNDLTSDTVVTGLQAMEIFRHGNVFLSGFYFPVNCPDVFTDLPFYLITQPLSNYNPAVLSLTAFFIYVLAVAVFSLIVLKLTGDRLKALLFAALFSNLTPAAYGFFMQPVFHMSAILFSGILFLLLLRLDSRRPYEQLAIAVMVFLITFSDNTVLAIFVLPFAFAYICLKVRKSGFTYATVVLPALCILAPAFIAYGAKLFIPSMVRMGIVTVFESTPLAYTPMTLPQNLQMYVFGLLQVFDDYLYTAIGGGSIGPLELIGLLSVALLIYAAWNIIKATKNDDLRLLLLFLSTANVLLFLGFAFTSLNAPRYLMFTSISLFLVMGLGYNRSTGYTAMAMAFIVVGALSGAYAASQLDYQPNQEQYGLIQALEQHNVTHAYAGYWDSNIITYLSNGKVEVRSVYYENKTFIPDRFLTFSQWYDDDSDEAYIIYHRGPDSGNMGSVAYMNNLSPEFQYGDYFIYKSTLPPGFENLR